jgi:excisionase family DNA binding protein
VSNVASLRRLPSPPLVEVASVEPGAASGFVSIEGASRYLGVGRRFVEELVARREVPSYKFGRCRRIRLSELEDWASRHREV